jgi:hypothetical protein
LIDEAAINKLISVIEGLEAATQEPFNRFPDTSETHEVEFNFRYVIHVSPIKIRVFQDRKQVAQWLGVPLERLSAERKDSS